MRALIGIAASAIGLRTGFAQDATPAVGGEVHGADGGAGLEFVGTDVEVFGFVVGTVDTNAGGTLEITFNGDATEDGGIGDARRP